MPTQPVDINSKIDLSGVVGDVSIVLVQKGAVQISHGISLFRGTHKEKTVVPYGVNPVNVPHFLESAATLRDDDRNTSCRGVVFHPAERTVTLRCDFVADGEVIGSSDEAVIDLTAEAPSREFYIRCLFQ